MLKSAVIGVSLLAVAGCGPAVKYRYELTATVETPEGEKQASSVIQIDVFKSDGLLPQGTTQHVYGEAVPVDLGQRGILFVLLTSPTDPTIAWGMPEASLTSVAPQAGGDTDAYLKNLRAKLQIKGRKPVPRHAYPRFVKFENLMEPQSVKEVNPDNLEASFGAGVRFKELTVELTQKPRTKGRIENILPWINTYSRKAFDGRIGTRASGPLEGQLSSVDFEGEKK